MFEVQETPVVAFTDLFNFFVDFFFIQFLFHNDCFFPGEAYQVFAIECVVLL